MTRGFPDHSRACTLSRLCLPVLVLIGFVTGGYPAEAQHKNLSPDDLTTRLAGTDAHTHYGGVMVAAGDTLRGPLVVVAGALDIQDGGMLDGDAWIVNGRLILTGTARVSGSLDLVNSETFMARRAHVAGEVRHYRCECKLDGDAFDRDGALSFVHEEDPYAVHSRFAVGALDINRVDYVTMRAGFARENPNLRLPHTRARAMLHVPWRENSRGYLGFSLDLKIPLKGHRLELLVEGYKATITNDAWQLSGNERNAALLLTGTDFCDYYERQGARLGLRVRPHANLTVDMLLGRQRDVSLHRTGTPSIFYPKRDLRENPSIEEGERLYFGTRLTLDTRYDRERPDNAWLFEGMLEKGFAEGPGELDYLILTFDVRRYTSLPFGLRWAQRVRLFTAYDQSPAQLTQSLNGYGGVRGARDQPFTPFRGDRLALVSSELRTGLPQIPILNWIFTRLDLLLFADAGLVTNARAPKAPLAFLDTPFESWRKTAGIGLAGRSYLPYVGIYVAQDLDHHREAPRVIFRLERSF